MHVLVEGLAESVHVRVEGAGRLLVRHVRPERGHDLFLAQRAAVAEEEEEHLLALLAAPLQVRDLAPANYDAQVAEAVGAHAFRALDRRLASAVAVSGLEAVCGVLISLSMRV